MEKINNLAEVINLISYEATIRGVLKAARAATDTIETFRESGNGCILFMLVPLCRIADEWIGGMSEYDQDDHPLDIHEYVVARTITPGGSHTIQWRDPADNHIEPVNCLAYAMMKIAYLSRLIKQDISDRDHDTAAKETNFYTEANGYSSHRGAVCVTIYYGGQPVMRFYIAVSGATEDEDLFCALKATEKLCTRFYSFDSLFMLVVRTVDGVEIFQRNSEKGSE